MKYTVHVDDYSIISGTSLQGYINCKYNALLKAFGEPGCGDQHKTDAEWIVKFEDGTVASIYNWKNGKSYCGDHGDDVEQITEWNIGGHDKKAADLVSFVIKGR